MDRTNDINWVRHPEFDAAPADYKEELESFKDYVEETCVEFEHNIPDHTMHKELWVENEQEVDQYMDVLYHEAKNDYSWDFTDILNKILINKFGAEFMSKYTNIEGFK